MGGFANISHDEIKEMFEIFYMIAEEKCEPDCDGDLPVQIKVINRNYFYSNPYLEIGYDKENFHDKNKQPVFTDDENFDRVLTNLSIATSEVEKYIRIRRIKG